jgi:hypothetical protein
MRVCGTKKCEPPVEQRLQETARHLRLAGVGGSIAYYQRRDNKNTSLS